MNTDTTTDLYRYFDAEGRLLYVGISFSAVVRATQHRKDKGWWQDVATMTVEHYSTRSEAKYAEDVAIASESPIYNIAGNTGDQIAKLPNWRCESCRQGIGGKPEQGYIQVDEFDEWHCICKGCDDGCERYWIDASRIRTKADLKRWTWHLADKNWFDVSSWQFMIRRQCSIMDGAGVFVYLEYDAWRDDRNRRLAQAWRDREDRAS